MLTVYGSKLCKDCIACMEDLDAAGIPYAFLDLADDLAHLKAFLAIRDTNALFDEAKSQGYIGIPCLVHPDGSVQLDWEDLLQNGEA